MYAHGTLLWYIRQGASAHSCRPRWQRLGDAAPLLFFSREISLVDGQVQVRLDSGVKEHGQHVRPQRLKLARRRALPVLGTAVGTLWRGRRQAEPFNVCSGFSATRSNVA